MIHSVIVFAYLQQGDNEQSINNETCARLSDRTIFKALPLFWLIPRRNVIDWRLLKWCVGADGNLSASIAVIKTFVPDCFLSYRVLLPGKQLDVCSRMKHTNNIHTGGT